MARAILFAAVPCFYAAIERARRPELRSCPIVVGGDPRKRGIVQSASPDARNLGVEDGMLVRDALRDCPRARPLRTDMKYYREVSGLLRTSLVAEVGGLEPVGLDAAFLDVRDQTVDLRELAERVAARVHDDLRLPLRIGGASVKFLAKIAADRIPHDGIEIVPAGSEADFLHALAVDVLPGVGPKTVTTLQELGAYRVGDLLTLDPREVERRLGNHGLRILELARGEDIAPVRGARAPRNLSQEHRFEPPQVDLAVVDEALAQLSAGLEGVLRRQGLAARRVTVKLRFADGEQATRSRTLAAHVDGGSELLETARGLLDRTQAGTRALGTLGLALSGLAEARSAENQLDLFASSTAD